MKKLFLILIAASFTSAVLSQTTVKKYNIGDSGCSAYFFTEPAPAELSYSPDSSRVYVMESADQDGVTCSTITVVLKEPVEKDGVGDLMKSYLDYLKEQFEILETTGYGEGQILSSHPSAIGIRDYWKDKDSDISVMSYSDGSIIEVMMIYADQRDKDIYHKSEVFFQGFRFPGDR